MTEAAAEREVGCCGQKMEAKKHRMEWCCGHEQIPWYEMWKNSKHKRMLGKCEGARWTGKEFNHRLKILEKCAFGKARHGKQSGSQWRGAGVVQEVHGLCSVPTGAEIS